MQKNGSGANSSGANRPLPHRLLVGDPYPTMCPGLVDGFDLRGVGTEAASRWRRFCRLGSN